MVCLMASFYGAAIGGYLDYSANSLAFFVLGTITYVLSFVYLQFGVVMLVLIIGISPEFEMGGVGNLRYEDFLVPIVFLSWVTRLVARRTELQPVNLKTPCLVYCFVALLSTLRSSVYGPLSSQEGIDESFLYFFKQVEYFVLLALVLNTFQTRRDLVVLIASILVATVAAAVMGLTMSAGFGATTEGTRLGGPAGETGNIFGAYLVFGLVVGAGVLLNLRRIIANVALVAYIFIIGVPVLLTFSRASLIALASGLFTLGVLSHRRILPFLVAGFLVLPYFLTEAMVERYSTIADVVGESPPSSWQHKTIMWGRAAETLLESPLLGQGIHAVPMGGLDNEFVKQLSEMGLLGFLAFLWLLWVILKTTWYTILHCKDPVLRGYAHGFLAGFVALLLHGISATTLTSIRTAEAFFIATGLLYAIYNHHVPKPGHQDLTLGVRTHDPGERALSR